MDLTAISPACPKKQPGLKPVPRPFWRYRTRCSQNLLRNSLVVNALGQTYRCARFKGYWRPKFAKSKNTSSALGWLTSNVAQYLSPTSRQFNRNWVLFDADGKTPQLAVGVAPRFFTLARSSRNRATGVV